MLTHKLTPKVSPEQARITKTTGNNGINGQIMPINKPKINSKKIIKSPAMAMKNRTMAPMMREIRRPSQAEKRPLKPGVVASPVSIWRKGEKKVLKIVPNEK